MFVGVHFAFAKSTKVNLFSLGFLWTILLDTVVPKGDLRLVGYIHIYHEFIYIGCLRRVPWAVGSVNMLHWR